MNTASTSGLGRSAAACCMLLLSACGGSQERRAATPAAMVAARNFNYEVEIDKGDPEWVPTQVFDDGRQTFIRFPAGMLVRAAPELVVLGPPLAELVNYRVKGDLYVVDRLFTAATLRLGQQDQEAVNIFRMR